MKDSYRAFYECVGERYPEDGITYATLSGLLRRKWIIAKIKTMQPGNMLDCGCNIGRLTSGWKRGPVFGIDISLTVLQRGKKIYPNSNFIHGDLRSLDFVKPNSIDNAIACEVLEHLDSPHDFLIGLYAVMKPGGFVLITTPSYAHFRPKYISLGILRSFGVSEGTEGTHYLHTAYKPDELAEMVMKCGFKAIEQGYFEYELRGWLKPLTILGSLYDMFSEKFCPRSTLNYLVVQWLEHIKLNLFYVFETFSFSKLLKRIFKTGTRAYVVAQK